MFKFIGLAVSMLVTTATLAHAADDYLEQIYGKDAAPKTASTGPKVAQKPKTKAAECETHLGGGEQTPFVPGSSLEIIATNNPIEDLLVNKPIAVSRERLSVDSDENRMMQLNKMLEYAREIATLLLSPEYMETEDAQIKVQTLLQNSVGKLPQNSMTRIESILDANLSALTSQNQRPQYRKDADNALAELTRVVTSYRRNGLDINTVANASAKLAGAPLIGRFFKGLDVVLRERFQTVKEAIAANDRVLELAVAEMLMRHEQMKDARLECRAIERYLELSLAVTEEVARIVSRYLESSNPTPEQRARFEQIVQKPLATSEQFILRNQTATMAAYHQFALLMDGNLDLIGIVSNLRGTAKLSISVFGAGRIIANEQAVTMNLARDGITAIDRMSEETVAQIRKQGVEIRAFPDFIINSTAKMIGHMDALLAELQLAQDSQGVILGRINKANSIFKIRIEEARKKGAQYDLVRMVDQVVDSVAARSSDKVEDAPVIP